MVVMVGIILYNSTILNKLMENKMDSGREFKKKYEYEKSLYHVTPTVRPRVDARVINDFHRHGDVRRTNIKTVK